MAIEELNDATFEAKLAGAEMAVVDFYADWCGQCMMFKPKFTRLSDEYPHVRFFLLDAENAPTARKTVTIGNLPFFGLYRGTQFVEGISTTREPGLRELLDKHFGAAP